MKRYVLGFLLTPHGTILIKKARPEWQAGRYNGIGGKIEEGESPLQAIVREFGEETLIQTDPRQWHELLTLQGRSALDTWEMVVFSGYSRFDFTAIFPRQIDEGTVELWAYMPELMDSTAAWLMPMCWDLHKHSIELAARQE